MPRKMSDKNKRDSKKKLNNSTDRVIKNLSPKEYREYLELTRGYCINLHP